VGFILSMAALLSWFFFRIPKPWDYITRERILSILRFHQILRLIESFYTSLRVSPVNLSIYY
jgi:hypothetical protein